MGPRSSPREMAAAGLRAVAVAFVAVILATTVWVCLVAGTVVLLRPALGQGGALLAVAGGLTALAFVALAVRSLARPLPPPAVAARSDAARDAAVSAALRVLQNPAGRRIALGAAGVMLLAAAALLPGGGNRGGGG